MISLILVMVCAIASGWLARRIDVPYPIVLVLAGIGLGVLYTWPALDLGPDVVLAIVIPSILYPAAIDTSWRDSRRLLRPILLLAIGLVATTTLAVGLALEWLVPGGPWAVPVRLGAICSTPGAGGAPGHPPPSPSSPPLQVRAARPSPCHSTRGSHVTRTCSRRESGPVG